MGKKSFFSALFGGSKHDKDMKRLSPIVEKVNKEEVWAKSLSDEDFPKITNQWKQEIKEGKTTLDELLPKAFALAREASFRVIGERHYDVQIMGALVLHQGSILEMKTGEGKTNACVPAAYLNALAQQGVHVITVNEYLAVRDSEWMGKIYRFLGLTVGVITSQMDNARKKAAYSSDITYGTNNEFGFDYLRDNMKWEYKDKIQASHAFCIVDEIDSILIDEARTPLIISGQAEDDSQLVYQADNIVKFLKECEKDPNTGDYYQLDQFARFDKELSKNFDEKGDYKIDEKSKRITFTKQGIEHIQQILVSNGVISKKFDDNGEDITSIYDEGNFEYIHYVTQAVKSHKLFEKDVDYVVKDGAIQIVDEFTGRILDGRRYSDGLHQAIEAKERVKIQGQSKTFATITFQNFFKMYEKLSGMTGTADTEAIEFTQIYNLDVVVVPTNKPVVRQDLPDYIFYNEDFKYQAIVNEIREINKTGQPILVGTVSIEKSELLSRALQKAGIKHEVLNAKNHAREAYIIGEAGAKGSVTIATNMAGRGTDIKLGGSIEHLVIKKVGTEASPEEYNKALIELQPVWKANYEEVKSLGGLYIIGSERHESRRIDNQLRGRSGRQGDPGKSRFFVSLDDNLMRLFAKEGLKEMIGRLGLKDGKPLEHKILSDAIEKAQKRVEERNFDIRKRLLEYDNVLNEQRNYIYDQRDDIMVSDNLIERVLNNCNEIVDDIFDENKTFTDISDAFMQTFNIPIMLTEEEASTPNASKILKEKLTSIVKEKEEQYSHALYNAVIRQYYLRTIDRKWVDHLDMLEEIKDASHLMSYAQKNPLVEYKSEAANAFNQMIYEISQATTRSAVLVKIAANPVNRTIGFKEQNLAYNQPRKSIVTSRSEGDKTTVVRTGAKVGRNDPCPCGSGKKYKQCCGK